VNVGRVCGGTQPNIVAERCEIEIDRRMIPGDREPLAEIRALVDATCGGVEGLESEVIEMPMTSIVPHTALETAADSTLAAAAGAAAREAGHSEPVFTGVTYWTDGGHLAANGIETVILGPGDIAYAHGPREHVEIAQLDRAAEVYRGIVARLLLDGT
jgi:succinyl-diaminopimelate desuccinylase